MLLRQLQTLVFQQAFNEWASETIKSDDFSENWRNIVSQPIHQHKNYFRKEQGIIKGLLKKVFIQSFQSSFSSTKNTILSKEISWNYSDNGSLYL